MKNVISWFIDLLVQCIFGSYVVLLIFGSNGKNVSTIENIRENVFLVLTFFLLSGYFATTGWFSIMARRENALDQLWVSVILFFLHASAFLIFIHAGLGRLAGVVILGSCVAAFSSLVGSSARRLLRSRGPRHSLDL